MTPPDLIASCPNVFHELGRRRTSPSLMVSPIWSHGGKARAESMSKEERSLAARSAALARWANDGIQRAPFDGDFTVGGVAIKAAVLPNGKRLLTQGTLLLALGRSRTPKAGTGGSIVDGLPFFLQADQLKLFISEELRLSTTPILFRLKTGQKAIGYDANLLPMVRTSRLSRPLPVADEEGDDDAEEDVDKHGWEGRGPILLPGSWPGVGV